MARQAKYSFRELDEKTEIREEKEIVVNLNTKGALFFSAAYMKKYEANNKIAKFFGDTGQRILAWKLIDKVNGLPELDISRKSSNRMLHQNPKNKVTLVSIKTILDRLGINMDTYKHLVVQETKDRWSGELHFVEIPDHRVIKPDLSEEE